PPTGRSPFPDYRASQYISLRREQCNLTKKVIAPDGQIHYVPDLDENGVQKRGPVTHSYSISSAPFETQQTGQLEFYILLEIAEKGEPGRLTDSLFKIDSEGNYNVT